MDTPALLKRERLVTVRLGAEKGSDLIKEATKASGALTLFEPTHGPVALFNASMVLLNGLITNDKFCMSRISLSRVHWARRPPQRRAPPAMTDYLHNDSDHYASHTDSAGSAWESPPRSAEHGEIAEQRAGRSLDAHH